MHGAFPQDQHKPDLHGKLGLYDDYRSCRITKEQYKQKQEAAGRRILEIENKIPELKDEMLRADGLAAHLKEQEAGLEELTVIQNFDKERLSRVIESVLVYGGERIEIVWKMDNFLFKEAAGKKRYWICSSRK